jgi:hypothetical protein
VGQVVPFPARRRAAYEAPALDRLIDVIDRRRYLRAVGEDGDGRVPRSSGTVIPFRLADR